jgi:hypothetical protein
MEQRNFGARLYMRLPQEEWQPVEEMYLKEATEYEWMVPSNAQAQVKFMNVILPAIQMERGIGGTLIIPFQSGEVTFDLNGEMIRSYIYPDERKITEEQYEIMIGDILEEAAVCFQYSGLTSGIDVQDISRETSWAQWNYILRSMKVLFYLMEQLKSKSLRFLSQHEQVIRREKVKQLNPKTEIWLDKNAGRNSSSNIPQSVRTNVQYETSDIYENKVLKRQLLDLVQLLNRYIRDGEPEIGQKALKFKERILYFLRNSFLQNIPPHQGSIVISQVFRKHPLYRQWFQWFDKLYKHAQHNIGFQYQLALKDTFQLYEMWCFMQVVKAFRKRGMLQDTTKLFKVTKAGIFLTLAEHYQSMVKLTEGLKLYYQRVFQFNSNPFYTFTQRMIPDIVLEAGKKIYIFDPKYRVPSNLGTALGEMHKYRDGILERNTNDRVVQAVFILSPTEKEQEDMRYFQQSFQQQYQMGAIRTLPGEETNELGKWIDQLFKENIEV